MLLALDRPRALHAGTDCIQVGGREGPGRSAPTGHQLPNSSDRIRIARDEANGLLAVLAGQLHDRARLGVDTPDNRDDADDAQLALAAYRDRPTDFATRLTGEFALIVWDARTRCLICVRDALGVVPLYYHLSRRSCVVSTRLGAVLAQPGVPRATNLGMLAEYLAFDIASRTETLYTDVYRVPPGHVLRVSPSGASLSGYWDLASVPAIRFRDPRDYAARFGELLNEAVNGRMSGARRVGISLSGGLDSSTVAGAAARFVDRDTGLPEVTSYSLTYPGHPWDERRYIAPVAHHLGIDNHQLPWAGFADADWISSGDNTGDLPSFPTLVHMASLFRSASADGMELLLTGEGGDLWHDGGPYPHLEMIARGDWRGLGLTLADDRRRGGLGSSLRPLALSLLWPLTPVSARLAWARRGRILPAYLDPDFCARVNLIERSMPAPSSGPCSDPGKWRLASVGLGGTLVYFYEHLARLADQWGIAISHPLMDRRLVEFGFAVPEAVKRRGTTNRLLMRQAMEGTLPEPILKRLSKASFGGVLLAALLIPDVRATLQSPRILDHEWIAAARARDYIDGIYAACDRGEPHRLRDLQRLWMIFACHVWLRSQ